jgi:hypothetical protein
MNGLDKRFIHFWVREVSDRILQQEIDACKNHLYHRGPMLEFVIFVILLNEKLRRVEKEIAIIDKAT